VYECSNTHCLALGYSTLNVCLSYVRVSVLHARDNTHTYNECAMYECAAYECAVYECLHTHCLAVGHSTLSVLCTYTHTRCVMYECVCQLLSVLFSSVSTLSGWHAVSAHSVADTYTQHIPCVCVSPSVHTVCVCVCVCTEHTQCVSAYCRHSTLGVCVECEHPFARPRCESIHSSWLTYYTHFVTHLHSSWCTYILCVLNANIPSSAFLWLWKCT